MVQRGVQFPASNCSSARLPAAFSRPARMSASISRSHSSAANSSNHLLKRLRSAGGNLEMADSISSTLTPRIYGQVVARGKRNSASNQPAPSEIAEVAATGAFDQIDGEFQQANFPGVVDALDHGAQRFFFAFDL